MKVKEYVQLLRRNASLLIIVVILGGLAGFGVSALLPTTYTSRTELFVSVATSGDPYELQMGSDFIQERIQTYVNMTDTAPVLQPAIDSLELDTTPEELAPKIAAFSDPRTVLISVEATEATAEDAARVSGAVSDSLVEAVETMENPSEDDSNRIRMTVFNPPAPPTQPDGPASWMFIGIGIAVGLAFGLGLALLRSALDNKVRTRGDVEDLTSASVLASIPEDPNIDDQPLITNLPLDDPRGEAFRRLRTNLSFAQIDDTNSAILVTSAQAQEGKSSTSINLAIALAQAGKRVALVDVDLRQPTIAEKTGLENSAGLTTALLGAADVAELLQPWGQDELYILTAGMMPPNPAELLDSRAMSALVSRLTGEFDVVLLDGPPLLPVADGLSLARLVGRVLVVACIGQVRTTDLAETLTGLDVLDSPVSLILNRVPRTGVEMSGYYRPYSTRAEAPAVRHGHDEPETGEAEGVIGSGTEGEPRQDRLRTHSQRSETLSSPGEATVRRTRRRRRGGTDSAKVGSSLGSFGEKIRKVGGEPQPHVWPGRFAGRFGGGPEADPSRESAGAGGLDDVEDGRSTESLVDSRRRS